MFSPKSFHQFFYIKLRNTVYVTYADKSIPDFTGNKRIRRLLNETAWHYRHRYAPSKELKKRRKDQPHWAIEIADAAGRRLSKRHRHLMNSGKVPCKANIAVARELAGFIWFMVTQSNARGNPRAA